MSCTNTVSVLMCVYNGERFLGEQLESLRNQKRQPDNVTIYDDCSTDSSVEIINRFVSLHNLDLTWKVIVNPFKKGWRQNFYDAITECDSDYIFFCDQDDIWHEDKISVMLDTMHKNPNIFVLSGLIETIDSGGSHIDILDWNQNVVYDNKIVKSNIGDTIYVWKPRIGCAMAIHKTVKQQLRYFECNEYFAHDMWALNIGALLGGCYSINYPVIKYRVHEYNATAKTTVKMLNKIERIQQLEGKLSGLNYIRGGVSLMNTELINRNQYTAFLNAIGFYELKVISIKKTKPLNVLRLLAYIKLYCDYFKFKQFVVDILEILNLRDNVRKIKCIVKNRIGEKHS